jgi:hypothetical protein
MAAPVWKILAITSSQHFVEQLQKRGPTMGASSPVIRGSDISVLFLRGA